MQIKIKSLELTNFKGIAELKVEFPEVANIFGPNESGKTTIFDSFTWLMFDKDSLGKSTFDIKTIKPDGEVINNLEHKVKGVIDVNGKCITLEKIFKEKWTKKRGEAEANFTGHITTYFIDETPVKKNEYVDKISEIIEEDVFKLISDPHHFMTLSVEKRRNMIMSLITFDDDEVYNSSNELKELKELVGEKSFNDFKKTLASKKTAMNDELKLIPARINEVHSMIVDEDFEKSKLELKTVEKDIEGLTAKITGATSYDNSGVEKQKKYFESLNQLNSKKNILSNDHNTKVDTMKREISLRNDRKNRAEQTIKSNNHNIDSLNKDIESHEESKAVLLKNWQEIKAAEFILDPKEKVCPTCNQELLNFDPSSLKQNFETEKKEQLSKIQVRGNKSKDVINISKESIDKLAKECKELSESIKETVSELTLFQKDLDEELKFDLLQDIELKSLEKAVLALEKYKVLEKIEDPDLITWEKQREELADRRDSLNKFLGKEEQNVNSKIRINKLEDQQKDLSNKIAGLEGQLFKVEKFITTKVSMTEDKINNKFSYIKFKLFDIQINGGIKQICEPTVKGISYSSTLNTAAKTNSGLDIINALSKHYGFNTPIWVDNRESINNLLDVDSQLICLHVAEKGTKLEIKGA